MKAQNIRSIAKEVRTGKNEMAYEELNGFFQEAREYVENTKAGWTEKFIGQIEAAMAEIEAKVAEMTPAVKEEVQEEKTEAKAVDDGSRKNFKTVVRMMAEAGETDTILAAIRWFAVTYGKETYATVKCVKGMLERRGYEIEAEGGSMIVILNGEEVADIEAENGNVSTFEIR